MANPKVVSLANKVFDVQEGLAYMIDGNGKGILRIFHSLFVIP
jgi:hypothetical protein